MEKEIGLEKKPHSLDKRSHRIFFFFFFEFELQLIFIIVITTEYTHFEDKKGESEQ